MGIVDAAARAGSHVTLASARRAAGFVEAPRRKRRFSDFTSTDEFSLKLQARTVQMPIRSANRAKLVEGLPVRVAPDNVKASDASKLGFSTNGQGKSLAADNVNVSEINNVSGGKASVETSEVINHVIDAVRMFQRKTPIDHLTCIPKSTVTISSFNTQAKQR
jgi:uncharacterized surface protein with fasciclin (FAS1) repeats